MIEIECTTRKWGDSLGITIPKKIVENAGIVENEKIKVSIDKAPKLPDKRVFGILRDKKLDAQKIKDELRQEWNR